MFGWSFMEWIMESCFDFRPYQKLYQGKDQTYRSDKEPPTVQNDPNDSASDDDHDSEEELAKGATSCQKKPKVDFLDSDDEHDSEVELPFLKQPQNN